MLILTGQAAIQRFMCPAGLKVRINFPCTCIDHGLDSQNHSLTQAQAASCSTVMRHHRLLMHGWTNTVTHQIPHNTIAMTFSIFLNSCANVTDTIANLGSRNSTIETFLGHIHQLLSLWANLPYCIGPARICHTAPEALCVLVHLCYIVKV